MPRPKRLMLHWLYWLYWVIFHFFDSNPSSGDQSEPVWRQTVQLAGGFRTEEPPAGRRPFWLSPARAGLR
jgi:hypothetical protein